MDLCTAAHHILTGPSLEAKLLDVTPAADPPWQGPIPDAPARDSRLRILHGHDRLPRLNTLQSAEARALCLHRFANHELQAIELFAWAILRYADADAPASFRAGLWSILQEEQRHLRAYLERLQSYGIRFGDEPLSGNFWDQARLLQDPITFVCAMGLTFENANLDFAVLYRDAFTRAQAPEDAAVMQLVHDDEAGHVGWALSWLRRFKHPGESDLEAYQRVTPFPLGLHRAKGRNFLVPVRRRLGMEPSFIEAMRTCRAPMEAQPLRTRPT